VVDYYLLAVNLSDKKLAGKRRQGERSIGKPS